jgi:hypothetical protein
VWFEEYVLLFKSLKTISEVDDVFEATPKLSEVNELSWKKKKSLDSVS